MPLKRLLSVYIIALLASSCSTLFPPKPPVDVFIYVSDPKAGMLRGSDRKGNSHNLLFTDSENFFCIDPKDAEEVLK